ncbi:MAG: helix-turn-helix domain-containing protein [Chloroflexi bacterium]|nr:helix-turn-helix domain-containing protein [Chloroflexota bacterium]
MPGVQSRRSANPRRLPRRNHYQEGPDFLFVATQGGRPPEAARDRAQATTVRRRRAALRRWAEGEPLATICAEDGCSRASLFRWRTRFEQGGLEALMDRPRRGRASELPPTLERLVLTVRLYPGRPHQGGGLGPGSAPGGDRAVRCAARADDRQRHAVRGRRPLDAQPLPAQPG